jgi:tripartite-type tricarboxylate transporter receptor subunit TctC
MGADIARRLLVLGAAAGVLARGANAQGQSYPVRVVTIIVPFPAGSATDIVARRLSERLRSAFSSAVVIDNRPGADGNLAAQAVLRNEADGHTVFVTTNSTHAANASLYKSLPYDPKADFAPIGGIMTIPLMLSVHPSHPARTVSEFVEDARKRQNPITFASGNTSSRGAAELFKARTGLAMEHIPYRGTPQALGDLMGGRVDCFFADPASAISNVQHGNVRVLGVTSQERFELLPNVPTIAESGYPGYELVAWVGAFVKAGTPSSIVERLSAETQSFVRDPATISYLRSIGGIPFPSTAGELASFAERDTQRWASIVATAGIEPK